MFCTPKFSGSAVHVKKTCTTYHKSHLNGSRRVVAGLTLWPKLLNFFQIFSNFCSNFAQKLLSIFAFKIIDKSGETFCHMCSTTVWFDPLFPHVQYHLLSLNCLYLFSDMCSTTQISQNFRK